MNQNNFALIDEDKIEAFIKSALLDGSSGVNPWEEQSHLIALSVALHIRIYVFNVLWNPQWETISGDLKFNCVPVQV